MALGRTKLGRRQPQQDDSFADAQEAQPDQELESYLQALAPADGSPETTGAGGGRPFGSSEVYQLRLPLMANERLKELAARQGTSPAALAKDWIMQHLSDGQDPNAQPVPEAAVAAPGDQFPPQSDPYGGPQQFGQDPGPVQQFGQQPGQQPGPVPPNGQQYDPYGADPYSADPYGGDPYGSGPYGGYGADPYGADPYGAGPYGADAVYPGEQQFAGGPPPGPGPEQFPGEPQFPGAPPNNPNNPYGGPVPPNGASGGQPPGMGTQMLNAPDPNGQQPNGQQPNGQGMPGVSPEASTQMIGAEQYGPLPADGPAEQFPSSDFPANQLPGQGPANQGPVNQGPAGQAPAGQGPAWPQQEAQQPPRARNPYVGGGPPPAPQQQYGTPPQTDSEITVPGNGYY